MAVQLTSDNVYKIVRQVLSEGATDAISVEGIVNNYSFSANKLREHRGELEEMALQLDENFFLDGGGWSFLNLCVDKDGRQWTGIHEIQEMLCCMLIGLGEAEFILERKYWESFPGGVPYFLIDRSKFKITTRRKQK